MKLLRGDQSKARLMVGAMGVNFRSAGSIEQRMRRIYSGAMQRLGVMPHLTRAQGAYFWVDTGDYVDQMISLHGVWERPQLEDLARVALANTGCVFLDIGANTGFYSVMFAMKNLAARIIAFEPDPGNCARLLANLKANDLSERIECVPLALGDVASEVTLYQGAKWNRGESTIAVPEQTPQDVTFKVKQARFDDLYDFAGKTLIVKIDVEGHEFNVLDGMDRTLRRSDCYLQIEHYGDRHDELKRRMADIGYRYLKTEDIDLYFTNMPDVA